MQQKDTTVVDKQITFETALKSPQLLHFKSAGMDGQAKAMLMKAITETLAFVPNQANPDQVALWAGRLFNSEAWRYARFDDIIAAMQKGIDGKYGKAYHFFTYQILTDWLSNYDVERDDYFEQRNKSMQSNAKVVWEDVSNKDLARLVELFPQTKEVEIKTEKPRISQHDFFDGQHKSNFERIKDQLTDEEIGWMFNDAQANDFTETTKVILTEIERRKNTTKK